MSTPPPDTVVVEAVEDGAEADHASIDKEQHKKHKSKHSKKHKRDNKKAHKSSKYEEDGGEVQKEAGHGGDHESDRESGEIEHAAAQSPDVQGNHIENNGAVEEVVHHEEAPAEAPASAQRRDRSSRHSDDDRLEKRRHSSPRDRSRSRDHHHHRDHHRHEHHRRRSPDDRHRRRSPDRRDHDRHRRKTPDRRDVDRRHRSPDRRRGYDDHHRGGYDDRRGYDDRDRRRREDDREKHRRRSASPRKREAPSSDDEPIGDADALMAKMQAALEGGVNEEEEEARLIEERRRKREEILAKHKAHEGKAHEDKAHEDAATPMDTDLPSSTAIPPTDTQHDAPPIAALKQDAPPPPQQEQQEQQQGQQPPQSRDSSPSVDATEQDLGVLDEATMWQQGRPASRITHTSSPTPSGREDAEERARQLEGIPAATDTQYNNDNKNNNNNNNTNDDMFAEEDDIFAATPDAPRPTAAAKRGLQDAYDDAEGYYNFQVGEVMDDRYEVFANLGRGVFSSVLRARDVKRMTSAEDQWEVAIKVLRANDTMTKAGQLETAICRKLAGADPEGKRHCVRMLRHFEYRGHLCLVFEPLDMNLRELTKKYGRGVGLNVGAVRLYTAQLLQALYHLRNCGVVHADLKPDNILVNQQRTAVKVCDFGNAMFDGPDNEYTPYIGSRFYRAPEVILGLRYGFPLDMWAIACVVYELFTGKILFPGKSNNEMLKRFMDVKGAFPKKMLRQGRFVSQHFEGAPNYAFALLEEDPVTKKTVRRMIANPVVQKDFAKLLQGAEGNRKKVTQLIDLLEKMTVLDPDRRITPKDALRHPFIKEK